MQLEAGIFYLSGIRPAGRITNDAVLENVANPITEKLLATRGSQGRCDLSEPSFGDEIFGVSRKPIHTKAHNLAKSI